MFQWVFHVSIHARNAVACLLLETQELGLIRVKLSLIIMQYLKVGSLCRYIFLPLSSSLCFSLYSLYSKGHRSWKGFIADRSGSQEIFSIRVTISYLLVFCVCVYENNYSLSCLDWPLLLQLSLSESVNQQRYRQEAFPFLCAVEDCITSNKIPAQSFRSWTEFNVTRIWTNKKSRYRYPLGVKMNNRRKTYLF